MLYINFHVSKHQKVFKACVCEFIMAQTKASRKLMEKKLLSLQKEVIALEKKLYPNKYSWRAFSHNDEPYLKFADHMVYPMELVSNIVKTLKKDTLKVGQQSVGLVLELPPELTKVVKSSTENKKVARKRVKTPNKAQPKTTTTSKSKAKQKKK